MHPGAVARAVAGAGLDGAVVCDHNAADNVGAVARAAGPLGIAIVPGMEVTTAEEVHVVAWLPGMPAAGALQSRVAADLPGRNNPAIFGLQVIADEHAEVLGFNGQMLAGATTWDLDRTLSEIHRVDGLAVAAHVDRERFGLVGQLGLVPPGAALDALELSAQTPFAAGRARFGRAAGLPVVTGSDAHAPQDVGRAVTFMRLERITLDEIRLALGDERGRMILGGGRPMEDLALHILDIAQNSLEAGATRIEIVVDEDATADRVAIAIRDNGRGMSPGDALASVDPFFTTRTTRAVGLGLPLLRQAAEAAGGSLEVDSHPGRGTRVTAAFRRSHIDRAPLGDLEATMLVLASANPGVDVVLTHRLGSRDYSLSSRELRAALDGGSLDSADGLALLRAAVRRGEDSLAGPAPLPAPAQSGSGAPPAGGSHD